MMSAATARAKKKQILQDLEKGLTFLPGTDVKEAATITILHIRALELMQSAGALDEDEMQEQRLKLYLVVAPLHPGLWERLGGTVEIHKEKMH